LRTALIILFERDKIVKNIWITYSWLDNDNEDVDYLAQELTARGYNVYMDKIVIPAGRRHWEIIGNKIDKDCDALIIYATQNSINSQPCKEEMFYGLEKALSKKQSEFPLISLLPSSTDKELLPMLGKSRIYISLEDPCYIQKLCDGIEGKVSNPIRENIEPFYYKWHSVEDAEVLEIRPRAGVWGNPFVGVNFDEAERLNWFDTGWLRHGPKGSTSKINWVTNQIKKFIYEPGDGIKYSIISIANQATPTHSIYVQFSQLPNSQIVFGDWGTDNAYIHN